jgi:hypothetical protein
MVEGVAQVGDADSSCDETREDAQCMCKLLLRRKSDPLAHGKHQLEKRTLTYE